MLLVPRSNRFCSMVDHDVVDTTADSCVIRIKGEDVRHLTFSIVRIASTPPSS